MSEDKSKRSGDQLKLNTQALPSGTQPLRKPSPGGGRQSDALQWDDPAMQSVVETTVARVGKHIHVLEQRVELLVHSVQSAGLPIPGVENWAFKHAVSPQGKKIIAYLEKLVVVNASVAQQIQVAIFRFHEARQAVTDARVQMREGVAGPHTLEEVKRKFYPLTNLHVEFRQDSLLAQMFPPPEAAPSPQARAATGHLQARGTQLLSGGDAALRHQQLRQATLQQGEQVLRYLAPGMEALKRTVDMQRPAIGAALLDIFSTQSRRERLLAQRLKDDPRAAQLAGSAVELYGHLRDQVTDVRKGGKFEPLAEQMEYLANLLGVWHQHPVLREFFPKLDRELFFVKT
ncbi:MAG: hypothetical protein VKP62_11690 [Candidatus Sericytochromatia bacterium]|nr:hypothetical protein [Candidatus Sericytochromatia bacterium]